MPIKAMNYAALAAAGAEPYRFSANNHIQYPEGETTDWYGFRRHNFEIDGRPAFIVEPPHPATGLPWSWCLQWPEAFVPRTPALQLLQRGFHHVHIDILDTYANAEGIRILEKFYHRLQNMRFHAKAALIGMSYGGLISLRWAAEHPETVGVIYLDAPVCSLSFAAERNPGNASGEMLDFMRKEAAKHLKAYHVGNLRELSAHPANPLNHFLPIARAGIPILAIRNGQDQSVLPESNLDVFAERLKQSGGKIRIIRRDLFGHHPHGLDDPSPLTDFILGNYPETD